MTEHPDDLLHIASCSTCRDRFTADNVVNFAGTRHREPERMREFLETARRLERERAGVEDVVADLLRATPPSEWSALASEKELHSSAAVEQLIEEVRNRVERTPADALTLANVATTIAESLPATSYPAVVLAQLCAMAWKERANTLRYLSRFEEALESVEIAEQKLKGFPAAEFDRAVVGLTRAMILHKLAHSDEAGKLLRMCRGVFADHGDSKMLLKAGLVEGAIHYNMGRFTDAEAVFTELRDVARVARDTESLARIENNLGYCATHFGDFRAANVHFSNGIALFNDLGCTLEATRAERGAGRLLIAKGQINAGLAYLRNARTAFASAGVAEDAALCGLEIVETLAQRGDTDAARELADQVARDVMTTSLPDVAVSAFETLREALREGGDEMLVHVRNAHALLESLHSG